MPATTVVVCDLHFSANDFMQQGDKRVLVKDVIPNIPYVFAHIFPQCIDPPPFPYI